VVTVDVVAVVVEDVVDVVDGGRPGVAASIAEARPPRIRRQAEARPRT
jgi:hypothetical protein